MVKKLECILRSSAAAVLHTRYEKAESERAKGVLLRLLAEASRDVILGLLFGRVGKNGAGLARFH